MENPYSDWATGDLNKSSKQIEGQILFANYKLAELQKKKSPYITLKSDLAAKKKKRMSELQDIINKEKNKARKESKRKAKKRESDSFDSQKKRIVNDYDKIKRDLDDLKVKIAELKVHKKLIEDVLKKNK